MVNEKTGASSSAKPASPRTTWPYSIPSALRTSLIVTITSPALATDAAKRAPRPIIDNLFICIVPLFARTVFVRSGCGYPGPNADAKARGDKSAFSGTNAVDRAAN